MVKKKSYFPSCVKMETLECENCILTGSVTSTPITALEENITVQSFEVDKDFEDKGFGDISF